MSMENFKTIVLINLVVISLFLTFNLWTYVPDSTSMQNTKFVQGNEEINHDKDFGGCSPILCRYS